MVIHWAMKSKCFSTFIENISISYRTRLFKLYIDCIWYQSVHQGNFKMGYYRKEVFFG